jgi:hypothetical protein
VKVALQVALPQLFVAVKITVAVPPHLLGAGPPLLDAPVGVTSCNQARKAASIAVWLWHAASVLLGGQVIAGPGLTVVVTVQELTISSSASLLVCPPLVIVSLTV